MKKQVSSKHGVPVVIGETLPETKAVFTKQANELDAPILFANEERWVSDWRNEHDELIVSVAKHFDDERKNYRLDLTGLYQAKNLLTVLQAVHMLISAGWRIGEHDIEKALLRVKKLTGLQGRWQVIHHKPYTVLDVGHNEDGIKQIVSQLEHCNFHKLHIIIGMVKDKDVEKVLTLLPQYAEYYFTKASIPRALPEDELMHTAKLLGLEGNAFATVNVALQHAANVAHADDMILVCGSVFVVGEVEESTIKW